jgi:hypothetical protein
VLETKAQKNKMTQEKSMNVSTKNFDVDSLSDKKLKDFNQSGGNNDNIKIQGQEGSGEDKPVKLIKKK